MIEPPEIHRITPNLVLWHIFDPKVKTDLYSTAISTTAGLFFIDPIPLPPPTLEELLGNQQPPRGIIVTNHNHWRAAPALADQLSIPIFARPSENMSAATAAFTPVTEKTKIDDVLEVIEIAGAVPGEIAIYSQGNDRTLVVGDALINVEPYGFTFLPPKYCSHPKQMRRSLRKLLGYDVERIFFAHGMPILSRASERLRHLLTNNA